MADPFFHCPELRGRITPAESSFFRGFTVDRLMAEFPHMRAHKDWPYTDEDREAVRKQALSQHSGDLWVFAYGSLMWDPAFHFCDVRRAFVPGYARKMILKEWRGARGTQDAPGLMAALDVGDGCNGLVFRIPEDQVDAETDNLFRREAIAPGYNAVFVQAEIETECIAALTFVADHSVSDIVGGLSRQEQIEWIAQGVGFLGTSHEYLANIVSQFDALGIDDPDCAQLLQDVDDYIAQASENAPT